MQIVETWPSRNPRDLRGYVYLLRYSSGAVKVGCTRDPRARGESLRDTAAQFGVTIVEAWLSPPRHRHEDAERRLLLIARTIGEQLAVETFRVEFEALVEAARRLAFDTPEPPRAPTPLERRVAERRRRVAELRLEGLTIPAIVERVGASLGTVHRDLAAAGFPVQRRARGAARRAVTPP